MASQNDLDRLIVETTSLAQRRASLEVEARQLAVLEHKQQGEITKHSKKVQLLAEQLHITQLETNNTNEANIQLENEYQVLKEASCRMEESLASMIQGADNLRHKLANEKEASKLEYEWWAQQYHQLSQQH
jgi:hypothetical protein